MRILQIITRSELGGAQSVVVNLANSLCSENEVTVAAGGNEGKMWDLLDSRVCKIKIPSLKRNISLLNDLRCYFALRKLYKKIKPDIIHLHSSKAGVLGRLAFPKSKIIFTVHGFDTIRLAHKQFLQLERYLQYRCNSIVSVSKYDQMNLIKEGIDKNVVTVYNGIKLLPSLPKDPFKDITSSGFHRKVLCIARLEPPKDVNLFIDVAKKLPDYAFIWIGNQKEYTQDYPKNVFFYGNITNAGAYCEFADLFFLPSNFEGLPIVILEALSFGTPVVASKVGGIHEILNGENGFAVDNNAETIAKTIRYILDDKATYTQMCVKAKASYETDFTIDKMRDQYLELYQKIYMSPHR